MNRQIKRIPTIGQVIDPRPKILMAVPETAGAETLQASMRMRAVRELRIDVAILAGDPAVAWNLAAAQMVTEQYHYLAAVQPEAVFGKNPAPLLVRDLDVIGLPGPRSIYHPKGMMFAYQAFWLVGADYEPLADPGAMVEVDAVGGGVLFVSRRVIEAYAGKGGLFTPICDAEGRMTCPPFFAACERAKAMGFHVWASYEHRVEMFQRLPVGAVMQVLNSRPAPAMEAESPGSGRILVEAGDGV